MASWVLEVQPKLHFRAESLLTTISQIGDPRICFVRMNIQALTVNISQSGFFILAAAGTVASLAGCPTAKIISGFSEAGRPSNAFKNFIGLGVWVSVERPA